MPASTRVDKLIIAEALRATEAGAIAASRLMGRGDREGADAAAVKAMREAMDDAELSGTIVIGEGERDEAPMLYIGEQVGNPEAAMSVSSMVWRMASVAARSASSRKPLPMNRADAIAAASVTRTISSASSFSIDPLISAGSGGRP